MAESVELNQSNFMSKPLKSNVINVIKGHKIAVRLVHNRVPLVY